MPVAGPAMQAEILRLSLYHLGHYNVLPSNLATKPIAHMAGSWYNQIHNREGILTMVSDEAEKLDIMRHSAAHVLAEAVQSIFPDAKFGIGPAIENGFYYDFDLPRPLTPDDLPLIEAKMKQIIASNLPFIGQQVTKKEARAIFAAQPYKLELIDEIPDRKVGLYRQGSFVDLCRGPHVGSTGEIKAFKLLSIAGAYWRGDEHRPMLQRVYGVAFDTEVALAEHLNKLEEAAKRDHRKLGRELDLFSLHEEAGPGLVHWHPKGAMIRHVIEDFWKDEHIKRGYDLVYTPHIAKLDLWKTSGHWEFYRDYLYSPMEVEGQEYIIKPMNCLGHIMIYKTSQHSYRELPVRYAELGTVYRYERSGVLHGLSRVRGFTQDDAHIFCRFDQLEDEVAGVLDLALFMIDTFGFTNYQLFLSTRPDKYAGTLQAWDEATETLSRALARQRLPYDIDPGEGVFYGPKIDIKFEGWQGPTIQVDFNLPQRFNVTYTGQDSQEHLVAMVHRTVLGSMERFLASLIEHYGGAFPVWLAPIQVMVIPVADRHLDYAHKLEDELKSEGVWVKVDARSETVNLKIRQAQLDKIPYMLVVGDREVSSSTVSVRLRTGEQLASQSFGSFKQSVTEVIVSRAKELRL
jgi:threonyl-tRNA synthetase